MDKKNRVEIHEFKDWTAGVYLIEAGCGMGKNYFVFNTLFPYAQQNGKRMLVFSNRVALREQQQAQTQEKDIKLITSTSNDTKKTGWSTGGPGASKSDSSTSKNSASTTTTNSDVIANGNGKDNYGHDKFDAFVIAEKAVKEKLKLPSTAQFCTTTEATIGRNGNTWTVKGWVDAQNGYGATVRANFVVTFTFASKDTYSVALCTVS